MTSTRTATSGGGQRQGNGAAELGREPLAEVEAEARALALMRRVADTRERLEEPALVFFRNADARVDDVDRERRSLRRRRGQREAHRAGRRELDRVVAEVQQDLPER